MSIEKNINSRIVHKHDIEANWIKATNFIPKQGEIIIYDIDDNHSYPRFKIGDGLTLVNNLPFGIVQSDQNQNDETAIDFIKNRLAYTIPGEYELISDADVPFVQGEIHGHSLYYTELTPLVGHWIDYNVSIGVPMQLTINDKVFNFTTKFHSKIPNCIYGGNLGLSWVNELDTGEDFFIQAGLDTPQDTIGFCVLCLTDLKPADSYRVSLKVIIEPDTYKKLDTNYYDRLAWTDNKTTTILFNGNISEDKYIHNWNSEVFYYHIYVSPRKIIPKDIIEIERTNISTGEVTKEQIVLQKTYEGSNIIYGVQGSFEFIPYVKIAPEPFEVFEITYPAGTYFTLFAQRGLENITGYISKATLLLESNIQVIDSKFLPLATLNQLGAVAPEAKTEVDVQPVTIDEEGRLWTEPTSNTIATDDGDGNVVLITMATQEPENIVTDDGDGNVEVHSTSLYNPFPGIETAVVGQIAQVAEIDENGNPIKWELINIENSSNNNIVIVEINLDDLTTSASSEEISEMYEAGKMIIGSINGFMGMIVPDNPTYAYSYLSFVENNQLIYCVVQINSSTVTVSEMEILDFSTFVTTDTYSTDKTTLINLLNNKITAPINAAVGQVLSVKTVNTDGVPIEWETIPLFSSETNAMNIPTPTAADAGKFLRVSAEGLYILEALVDVSEVGA